MQAWQDRWTSRGDAELHWTAASGSADLTPLVYRGGALSDGTGIHEDLPWLEPRTIVAAGQRGLGRSSAPEAGYAFEAQVADLGAILDDARLDRIALMAHSMGVPIALGWALEHLERLAGLVLLDYPPVYPPLTSAWAERSLEARPAVAPHVIAGLVRDARRVDLWGRIGRLTCPALIVAGGRDDARLSADEVRRYAGALPNSDIHVFEDAGHRVFAADPDRFWRTVGAFLQGLD